MRTAYAKTIRLYLIRKTRLYNFDPLKPHFHTVEQLGFTGVYIIFSYFCSKHRLWVFVRTASTNLKNIRIFHLEIFPFLVVKFSIYMNRHVFVMCQI